MSFSFKIYLYLKTYMHVDPALVLFEHSSCIGWITFC